MSLSGQKERAREAVEERGSELIALGEAIYQQPELGFKERNTSRLVEESCRELGLEPQTGLALTGVKAVARGGRPGPTVGLICELDAVICSDHPDADPTTGACHACGHNMQVTAAVGALAGLMKSGVLGELAGNVALIAVPAEEAIEVEYRRGLQQQGKIAYLGGKQEFIRLGVLNDLDVGLNVHADNLRDGRRHVGLVKSSNGFVVKTARYQGKAAHAGAAPWDGINALNACMMGLMGIHAQRETFRDEDTVRVHPVITAGGDSINVVPSDVVLETYVRAATVEAMGDANAKVSRALRAGADCVGADVELTDLPGYLPCAADAGLCDLVEENAAALLGEAGVSPRSHMTASSDMGDLTQFRPSVLTSIGCITGGFHSRDYRVADREMAYVVSAEVLALTVIDLLSGEAERARTLRSGFTPRFSEETYDAFWANILGGTAGER